MPRRRFGSRPDLTARGSRSPRPRRLPTVQLPRASMRSHDSRAAAGERTDGPHPKPRPKRPATRIRRLLRVPPGASPPLASGSTMTAPAAQSAKAERHSEQPSAANVIGRAAEQAAVNGARDRHDRQPDGNRQQSERPRISRFDRERAERVKDRDRRNGRKHTGNAHPRAAGAASGPDRRRARREADIIEQLLQRLAVAIFGPVPMHVDEMLVGQPDWPRVAVQIEQADRKDDSERIADCPVSSRPGRSGCTR